MLASVGCLLHGPALPCTALLDRHRCRVPVPDTARCCPLLQKNRIGLKAPMATPIGKGFRSLNLTLRKELQLYANVRPCLRSAKKRSEPTSRHPSLGQGGTCCMPRPHSQHAFAAAPLHSRACL